jgi:butyryl-CoA dehydrogenase
MNYEYDDKTKELIDSIEKVCAEKIAPLAEKLDQVSASETGALMRENVAVLGASGAAVALPKEFGGRGSWIDAVAVMEAVGKHCSATMFSADTSFNMAGTAIAKYGSNALKKKYLSGIASGKIIGAFAVTEWESGSAISEIALKAEKSGNGWTLSGLKAAVTNAPIADVILTLAKTADGSYAMFAVDKSSKGLSVGAPIDKMGLRGSPTSDVKFDDCTIDADALVGSAGDGLKIAEDILVTGRITFAAGFIGVAMSAMSDSLAHANKRTIAGKKIFANQEVSFKISDMKTLTDAARLTTQLAAWRVETGGPEQDVIAACAKTDASEAVVKTTDMALQIFGGKGYLKGNRVERLYRDAKFADIGRGTNEVLRMYIAKKELAKYL